MAAKTKQPDAPQEPQGFPVTIKEYLSGKGRHHIEAQAAFERLMVQERTIASKPRSEWDRLFSLFMTKPTKVPWAEWTAKTDTTN